MHVVLFCCIGTYQDCEPINANQADVHNLFCSSGCGDIVWIVNGQKVNKTKLAEVKGEYSVMSINDICSESETNKSYGCQDCMNLSESVRISSSLQIMSNATLKIECMMVQTYHTKTFHVVRKGYNITVRKSECACKTSYRDFMIVYLGFHYR